jgi:hypothetical protein
MASIASGHGDGVWGRSRLGIDITENHSVEEVFMMERPKRSMLLALVVTFMFAGLLYGQRAGRGIITGIVTDPVNSAVPDATVTVVDEVTALKFTVKTSSSGNYGTPLLPLGTYTVQVEKEGFKTYVQRGIVIISGIEYRQDVMLELGTTTTVVEVKAASSMINVQTADIGHTLNQKYYQDLPVVMGTDIRLAESLLMAQPGYTPMEPNGDPMFRGSAFASRINGGQAMSTESFLDGAAIGYVNGHNETHESSPPIEAIAEMRVDTGSFSAQYGHTSGGFIEYTTKSGTNQFHGSLYEYVGNKSLNSRFWNTAQTIPFQNNSFGVTAGGPVVIPHLYNGKNRTYFFTNFDLTYLNTGVNSAYNETVPTALMTQYNFSELLSYGGNAGKVVGTDALGRNIMSGEIFDPSSTRLVTQGELDPVSNTVAVASGYVRDPIPGNIIANSTGAEALKSTIGGKVNTLFQSPLLVAQIPGVGNNHLGTAYGNPNGKLDPKTWLLRIDHQISPAVKMYTTWYQNSRPAIRNCSGPEGCNEAYDGESEPQKNTDYIGAGFYQRISVRYLHQQFDWVVKPNLFNHTTVSFDRWYMGAHGLSDGVGWISQLGLNQDNGNPIQCVEPNCTGGAFPTMGWSGGIAPTVAGEGNGWIRGFEATNRWQFLDDLSWIKGKHTVKVGYEYRHHQIPQDGWNRDVTGNWQFNSAETAGINAAGTVLGGASGDPYASMLLGQVDYGQFTIFQPGTWREAYTAAFINDEWKVNSKLSINIGLRYDYMFARTEAHNRYSSFDPTLANPEAGGLPGAMAFAGPCTGCTGKDTFESPENNDWGPRFGFAYRVTNKDVIRGGYGMYYSSISLNYSAPGGYPDVGIGATYPTAINTTGGRLPTYYWDYAASGSCPMAGVTCGFPSKFVVPPPLIGPSIQNGEDARGVAPDSLNLPRYQNWSLTYERQLTTNTSFQLSYIGSTGTRLPMNGVGLGLLDNQMNPSYLSSVGAGNLGYPITSTQAQALPIVQAMPSFGTPAVHMPYANFTSDFFPSVPDVAQALRTWPQYASTTWRSGFPGGYSNYNGLQAMYERRFAAGLQMRVAYTWSKLINNGADNSLIWGAQIQNPVNMAAERSLALDDVPHVLIITYTYALPFGKGMHWVNRGGVANQVIGGWHFAAIQRYNSGRPVNIVNNCTTCGDFIGNQQRPNKIGNGSWSGGKFDPTNPGATPYWQSSAWSSTSSGTTFGNEARTDPNVRDLPVYNEDLNLFKEFPIYREDVKFRLEMDAGNALNRHFYCTPNTDVDSGSFGVVTGQCNQPRHFDFGAKLTW